MNWGITQRVVLSSDSRGQQGRHQECQSFRLERGRAWLTSLCKYCYCCILDGWCMLSPVLVLYDLHMYCRLFVSFNWPRTTYFDLCHQSLLNSEGHLWCFYILHLESRSCSLWCVHFFQSLVLNKYIPLFCHDIKTFESRWNCPIVIDKVCNCLSYAISRAIFFRMNQMELIIAKFNFFL